MPIKANGEVLKQYIVIGRNLPCEKEQIFSSNDVIAKSRFWYFVSMLRRVKKANGEILSIKEVLEAKTGMVRNYRAWLKYDFRTCPTTTCTASTVTLRSAGVLE